MTYSALILHSDYAPSNIRLLCAAIVDHCAIERVVSMRRAYPPAAFRECISTQNGKSSDWLFLSAVMNAGNIYMKHQMMC